MNENIDDTITIDLSDLNKYNVDHTTMAISSMADDTNVDLTLTPRGTGSVNITPSAYQYPTYSIGTTSGMNGTSPWTISSTSPSPGLKVNGNAEFDGDVKIKGVSIAEALDTITKRLAILVPDPEKLEHFAALKKAYEHYKTLEALCQMPKEESKD
jgi:hypothetical protein